MHVAVRRACLVTASLITAGCTTLREVSRDEIRARAERSNVKLATREGIVYEFDRIVVAGDSVTGWMSHEFPGENDRFLHVVPLERVATLSVRRIDWLRTGLMSGVLIAAIAVAPGVVSLGGDYGAQARGRAPNEPRSSR